jgi:hypothetical protein
MISTCNEFNMEPSFENFLKNGPDLTELIDIDSFREEAKHQNNITADGYNFFPKKQKG